MAGKINYGVSKPWNSSQPLKAQRRVTRADERRSEYIHVCAHTGGGLQRKAPNRPLWMMATMLFSKYFSPAQLLDHLEVGWEDHMAMSDPWVVSSSVPRSFNGCRAIPSTPSSLALAQEPAMFKIIISLSRMRLKHREVKLLTQSHTDKKQNWDVSLSHLALESNSYPLQFHHLFPQAFLTSLKNHFNSPTCSLPCDFLEWQLWYSTL